MKASSKKRLKKLEEILKEKSAPLDPVIIFATFSKCQNAKKALALLRKNRCQICLRLILIQFTVVD